MTPFFWLAYLLLGYLSCHPFRSASLPSAYSVQIPHYHNSFPIQASHSFTFTLSIPTHLSIIIMHSSFIITALAAAASVTLVSAHGPSLIKDIPAVVDIDAPVAVIAPILSNADIEVIDLKKRGGKVVRGLAGVEVSVGVDGRSTHQVTSNCICPYST